MAVPARRRFELALTLLPFVAGIGTAAPLWGDHAPRIFFATAAEVIALGAVAMALEGRLFRVSRGASRGVLARVTMLISVGTGLAFAFGALARADGGAASHMAMTAGALAMGTAAIAVEAFFGTPGVPPDE